MTPLTPPTDTTLARFAGDELPPAERADVAAWLAAHPEDAVRLQAIQKLLAPPGEKSWDVDTMWSDVRAATIDADTKRKPERSPMWRGAPRRDRRISASMLGLAAAAGIVAVLLVQPWKAPAPVSPVVAPVVASTHYTTKRGEQAVVHLSDGTRVTMAPMSHLRIPADYGDSTRDVHLTGEAVFDVKHDAAKPFIVRSRNVVATDLGTRFDVRAYDSDSRVIVAVAEGEVFVNDSANAKPETILREGSMASIDSAGSTRRRDHVRLGQYFDWTGGMLTFENEALGTVLTAIGRWYAIDIRVADRSLSARRVTANFSTDQPNEMVEALAAAVGASVVRSGSRVTLQEAGR